jgi:hypothetical protein
LVEFPASGGGSERVIGVVDPIAWWLRDEQADAS